MELSIARTFIRIGLYVSTVLYVLFLGPITEPDTFSHWHLTMLSPPGYPIFLYGFKKVLGAYAFHAIVWVQLFFNIVSIVYFVRFLRRSFSVSNVFIPVLDVILLVALWIPHLTIANKITTEAVSYPLFLWCLYFFVNGILFKKYKQFAGALIVVYILIQMRTQFFFILPVFVLLLVYEAWRSKAYKTIGMYLGLLFLLPLLISLADKSFHYLVSDRFESTSNTGVQILTLPFFVSEAADYKVFETEVQQSHFKQLHAYAVERKMLDDFYEPIYGDTKYHYFHDHYTSLSFGVLSEKGRALLYPDAPKSIDALIANNKLLMKMTIPLLLDNFWEVLELFYYNCIHAFRSVYSLLLALLVFIGGLFFWIKSDSKIAFLGVLFMGLTFCNIILVCMVVHSLYRYMFYHQWMLAVLVVLCMDWALKHQARFTS